MKPNKLERKILASMEEGRLDLDLDQLWEDIEPHLEKKKKRRFIFFWFWGIGLVLLLGGLYWGHHTTKKEEQVPKKALAITPVEKKEPAREARIETEENNFGNSNAIILEKKKVVLPPSRPTVASEKLKTTTAIISMAQPDASTSLRSSAEVILLPLTLLKDFPVAGEWGLDLSDPKLDRKHRAPRLSFKKRKPWSWYAEFYGSPDLSIREIRTEFFSDVYANERKNTERQLEAFSVGMNLQLQHRNGFLAYAGLEYRQVTQKLEIRAYNEEDLIRSDGILSVLEDYDGNLSTFQTGAKPITQITDWKKDTYNYYRSINIPLGIGFHYGTSKSQMAILGGVDFNILFSTKGELLNNQGAIEKLEANDLNGRKFYRKRTGMGLWLSWQYAHSFNQKWSWFVAPYLRYQVGALTTADYWLSHKQHSIGLRLGFRSWLNPPKEKK